MNQAILITLEAAINTRSGKPLPEDNFDFTINEDAIEAISEYGNGYIIGLVVDQFKLQHLTPGYQNSLAAGVFSAFTSKIHSLAPDFEVELIYSRQLAKEFGLNMKPQPDSLLFNAAAVKLELSLPNSILIGTTEKDKNQAENAGIGEYADVKEM